MGGFRLPVWTSAAACAACFLAFAWLSEDLALTFEERWRTVEIGGPEAEAVAILGEPDLRLASTHRTGSTLGRWERRVGLADDWWLFFREEGGRRRHYLLLLEGGKVRGKHTEEPHPDLPDGSGGS